MFPIIGAEISGDPLIILGSVILMLLAFIKSQSKASLALVEKLNDLNITLVQQTQEQQRANQLAQENQEAIKTVSQDVKVLAKSLLDHVNDRTLHGRTG